MKYDNQAGQQAPACSGPRPHRGHAISDQMLGRLEDIKRIPTNVDELRFASAVISVKRTDQPQSKATAKTSIPPSQTMKNRIRRPAVVRRRLPSSPITISSPAASTTSSTSPTSTWSIWVRPSTTPFSAHQAIRRRSSIRSPTAKTLRSARQRPERQGRPCSGRRGRHRRRTPIPGHRRPAKLPDAQ